MKIKAILQEGVDLTKRNLMLFVPSIASSLVVGILFLIAGMRTKAAIAEMEAASVYASDLMGMAGRSAGAMAFLLILSAVIMLLGHSMTVGMACDVVRKGTCSLKAGYEASMARLIPLVISAVVVGVLTGIGMTLLVLPGIIIAFFFLFTFVGVMHDDLGAFEAIKKSIGLGKNNFGDVLIFFLVLIALALLFGLLNLIVNLIPVLGQIISIIIGGVYAGYSSVLLVLAYRVLTNSAGETAEGV